MIASEADGALAWHHDHAQEVLGDIVFLELPPSASVCAGRALRGDRIGQGGFRHQHARGGVVVAANDGLVKSPEQVNADAYAAWMFKIRPTMRPISAA